jgi:hypothetical protein
LFLTVAGIVNEFFRKRRVAATGLATTELKTEQKGTETTRPL